MALSLFTWQAQKPLSLYTDKDLLEKIMQSLSVKELFLYQEAGHLHMFVHAEDTIPGREQLLAVVNKWLAAGNRAEEEISELKGQQAVAYFLKSANGLTGDNRLEQVQSFSESFNLAKKATLIGPVLQRLFQRSIWLHEKIRLSTDYFRFATEYNKIFSELAEKIFGSLTTLKIQLSGFDKRVIPVIHSLYQLGCRRFVFDGSADNWQDLTKTVNISGTFSKGNKANAFDADILIYCANAPQMDEKEGLERLSQRGSPPFLILNIDSDASIQRLSQKAFNVYCYSIMDLQNITNKNRHSQNTVLKDVQPWINKEVTDFYHWLSGNDRHKFGNIIGQSSRMQELFELMARISQTDISVLIQGASGTGKELVSCAIHDMSARSDKPFIAVNCGAIPENLLESELFGHIRGSFTGAVADKKGLFYEANNGTIMLDEIAEMPQQLQVKLLRFLQEGDLKPVGSNETIKVDVRVIAATNKDLKDMVDDGSFRSDLYYRLNVILLELPSLNERREDIVLLADFFLKKYARKLNKEVHEISEEAMLCLQAYHWPGNVRELENSLEHAVALSLGKQIVPDDLPDSVRRAKSQQPKSASALNNNGFVKLKDMEKAHISRILHETSWDYEKACKLLEIGRTTLWRKIKEYDIQHQ